MKQFYTEKDIEDLFNRGTNSLRIDDDVALTDLAYEKARRLGVQLIFDGAEAPPLAPVRPYLSDKTTHPSTPISAKPTADSVSPAAVGSQASSAQRIRSAVIARLGNQVDAKLLDTIIQRVVKSTGVK